jgi:hypothetical protein
VRRALAAHTSGSSARSAWSDARKGAGAGASRAAMPSRSTSAATASR